MVHLHLDYPTTRVFASNGVHEILFGIAIEPQSRDHGPVVEAVKVRLRHGLRSEPAAWRRGRTARPTSWMYGCQLGTAKVSPLTQVTI